MQLEFPLMSPTAPETERWQKLGKQKQNAVIQKLALLIEKVVRKNQNQAKGGDNERQ